MPILSPKNHPPHLEDEWFDIVAKARQGKGWSLAETAQRVGVEFEVLEHWESGRGVPQPDQLSALAGVLELDFARLLVIQRGGGIPLPRPREGGAATRYVVLTGEMGSYPVHGYLLYQDGSPDAVLVDTAYEPMRALDAVLQRRLMLRWIVLTHCHRDHMEGASFLKAQTGARIAVPQTEWGVYRAHHREAPDLVVLPHQPVEISPTLSLLPLPTPGHTSGGTSYLVEDLCCVGDALFAGSVGRSMSPTGYTSLLASLRTHILSLPPDTVLLPGHGPLTTVGEEQLNNPFFPGG